MPSSTKLAYIIIVPDTLNHSYRMADNFRGMPIFVIFVVDLQSRNFPPPKINTHRYMRIGEGCGQKHRSAATYSLLASNSHYCHPADGVFTLMLFIQVSLQEWLSDKGNRARWESSSRDLWTAGLLSQILKPRKWLSLTFHEI